MVQVFPVAAQFRRSYPGFGGLASMEYGLGVGPSFYQGDLTLGLVSLEKTKLNIGGFVRFKTFERVSFRVGMNYGKVAGDDQEFGKLYNPLENPYGGGSASQQQYYERYKRNLNFWSYIFEMNALVEVSLYHPRSRHRPGTPLPYAVAGVGYFHFNPRTTDRNGNEVMLRGIPTEIYKSYKLWQFCLPAGLGVRFNPDENTYISIELGYRKLFTDWLDDVHHNYAGPPAAGNIRVQQLSDRSGEINPAWGKNWDKVTRDPNQNLRGDPKNNDSYIFAMISINRAFRGYRTCTNF